MNIELQANLLKLKGFLNEINHISYSYSQIGKENSFGNIDDKKAIQLIKIYKGLLDQARDLILNYEKSVNK